MRTRAALVTAVTVMTAVTGALATADAAKPRPKPKPIVGSYDATATPNPTVTDPLGTYQCRTSVPVGIHRHTFRVPAAGALEVHLGNQLDWSLAVSDATGQLATADGGLPTDPESLLVTFAKPTTVTIDACNWAGEPVVPVTYTFTYK